MSELPFPPRMFNVPKMMTVGAIELMVANMIAFSAFEMPHGVDVGLPEFYADGTFRVEIDGREYRIRVEQTT
jgi:hypothetical protein